MRTNSENQEANEIVRQIRDGIQSLWIMVDDRNCEPASYFGYNGCFRQIVDYTNGVSPLIQECIKKIKALSGKIGLWDELIERVNKDVTHIFVEIRQRNNDPDLFGGFRGCFKDIVNEMNGYAPEIVRLCNRFTGDVGGETLDDIVGPETRKRAARYGLKALHQRYIDACEMNNEPLETFAERVGISLGDAYDVTENTFEVGFDF